jgi:hypothetical protein
LGETPGEGGDSGAGSLGHQCRRLAGEGVTLPWLAGRGRGGVAKRLRVVTLGES